MPSTVAHPLVLADRAWFDSLLCCYGEEERRLAAFSFIYHTIWQGLLAYEWLELDDHYYLLARDRNAQSVEGSAFWKSETIHLLYRVLKMCRRVSRHSADRPAIG